MLNWDDYNTEEGAAAAAPAAPQPLVAEMTAPDNAVAAPEPTLQTSPQPAADPAPTTAAITDTAATEAVSAAVHDNVAKAKEAIERIEVAPGLEELEMGAGRVSGDEKAMINCRADLNQLVPFKYDWAWQKYLDGCANHWMPQEINMTADVATWKSADGLSEDGPLGAVLHDGGSASRLFRPPRFRECDRGPVRE